ncbi:restriction endonuclease subunit S [Nostoc sp.]|uniref:restriction endonuclease subunit S n=1 Tax=Nostoc sp. TaxID=1180 RepID=UPI002FF49A65
MKVVDTWIVLKIKDILQKIIGGGTPSKSKPEYWNGSIPWASVKDMKDGIYKLHSTVDSITEIGLKNSSSNLIPKGTIIISTRMGLGRCFIPSIDVAINQDLKALITKKEVVNTNYLLWLMVSLSEKLQLLGTGTTVKGITIETLNNIEILLPPLPT